MSNKFNLGYIKPDKTVWHTLAGVHVPQSNPNPVKLKLRSAGRINAEYNEAILKLDRQLEQEGARTTVSAVEAADTKRIKLFAKHVVLDWCDVNNEDGSSMPFTARDVEDLLLTISIEMKRPELTATALARAADQSNFSDGPTGSPEALGKS